jgi:hypothetical protein
MALGTLIPTDPVADQKPYDSIGSMEKDSNLGYALGATFFVNATSATTTVSGLADY